MDKNKGQAYLESLLAKLSPEEKRKHDERMAKYKKYPVWDPKKGREAELNCGLLAGGSNG